MINAGNVSIGQFFHTPPYTNYMDCSKENMINNILLDMQSFESSKQIPAVVLSSSSSGGSRNL